VDANNSCRAHTRPEFILSKHRPEKADQFPGDRHVGFTRHLAVIDKIPVPSSKPLAGAVGNVNGRKRIDAVEAPQNAHDFPVGRLLGKSRHFLVERSQTLHAVLQFGKIDVEHVPQARHVEFQTPHPTKMLLRPVIAIGKDIAVAGQEFDNLMLDTFEIDPGRIPTADQVPGRLLFAVGGVDLSEKTGLEQTQKLQSIAVIRLDPIPGLWWAQATGR